MLEFFQTTPNNFAEPVLTKYFLVEYFNPKKAEKMINMQPLILLHTNHLSTTQWMILNPVLVIISILPQILYVSTNDKAIYTIGLLS